MGMRANTSGLPIRLEFHRSLGAMAMVALLGLSHVPAFGQTIADFTGEYLSGQAAGQTRAARSPDGWDYLTNTNGTIGASANYVSLTWSTALLAYGVDGTAL